MLIATTLLTAGFAAGWWVRDARPPGTVPDSPSPAGRMAETEPAYRELPRQTSPQALTDNVLVDAPADDAGDDLLKFDALLNAQQFSEATDLYYAVTSSDPYQLVTYRPVLLGYLQRCLRDCDGATFYALIDAWLATFYDDLDVLLSLAAYQAGQGQAEAAADTLLLARTYALDPAAGERVSSALQTLTRDTDQRLSSETAWLSLLGYYEYLADVVGLTNPYFRLRQAQLYVLVGESARALSLLNQLETADDGSDPRFSEQLAALLEKEREPGAALLPTVAFSDAVPLQRRGDSYLVEVTINDREALTLLLDTGASITALSYDAYNQLYRPDLTPIGKRLFNTANGYTRGDIYRSRSLTLGTERLQDVDVAVLDLRAMDGVDGLLGMNVLRQFRFELDQTNAVLQLKRR